jgi:protein SCO1
MKGVLAMMIILNGFMSELSSACESHRSEKTSSETLDGSSLYHISGTWKDSSGEKFSFKKLLGHPVIVSMAYTHCTYTCPMIVAKLKEIESELIAVGVKDYRIVIASLDPVKDTPLRLAQYMEEKKLVNQRWVMLSPQSDNDVRELAAVLGVTYSRDKGGDYSHSNVISHLNQDGVIQSRINGIAASHQSLVDTLSNGRD